MDLQNLKKLNIPDSPGVYIFKGNKKDPLYIGKATSLKSRVRSYFDGRIKESRGEHIENMAMQAKTLEWVETDSVLEALLLEANLIKKYKPRYNTKEKDDKSFNYVVVTKEAYPRVMLMRGKELFSPCKKTDHEIKYLFGPFPRGSILKGALKIIRKILPFRDTCLPKRGAPCFNRQINLCPGVCTGEISQKEYAKQIQNIKLLFEGKKKNVINRLTKEMSLAAKELRFENAQELKRKIFSLKHIQDVALIKNDALKAPSGYRIEGYDIAHISGKEAVGSMVVVSDGELDTDEYRKFKIKSFDGVNDTRALKEILARRLEHSQWQLPRLIVVDGGKAQKNAAEKILNEAGIAVPVVSVVKDERHRPKGILGRKDIASKYEKEILLANTEAHRFAVKYHRQRRKKSTY